MSYPGEFPPWLHIPGTGIPIPIHEDMQRQARAAASLPPPPSQAAESGRARMEAEIARRASQTCATEVEPFVICGRRQVGRCARCNGPFCEAHWYPGTQFGDLCKFCADYTGGQAPQAAGVPSTEWGEEFARRRAVVEQRTADDARRRDERAHEARLAAQERERQAQAADVARMAFAHRVENEVIRPFLRAADSPGGRAAAQTRGLFRSKREWSIQVEVNRYTHEYGHLAIFASGDWSYSERAKGYAGTYEYDGSTFERSYTFDRIAMGRSSSGVFCTALKAAEDLVFERINGAVFQFMVDRNIRPR